jgi:magnesium chelatase family protein
MDRIDLQVVVSRIKPEEITQHQGSEDSATVRQRVLQARQQAQNRFKQEARLQCNADMQSRHLKQWCPLNEGSRILLEGAVRKLGLSARATDRILKVSRTIADLDGQEHLQTNHIAEAIQYRTLDRMA